MVRSSFSLSWVVDEHLEFVKQIALRLASAEINYMMTGSMAMAVYATPRMTRDIDVQGTPVAVVAPEDLILSKLDWARESGSELQRRDVQNIIAAVGDLDWDYLEQWADELQLGEMLEQVRQG